jgi:ABC-2 type transport system permease protein
VATLLFLAATLAQGLLISVTTRHMQLAMQISIISGLLPNMLLSGFIFAVENMPLPFRILTSLLAPKWYMMICRGIFLKGAGPLELWVPFASLAAISSVLIILAVRKFKTDLEP